MSGKTDGLTALQAYQQANDKRKHVNDLHRTGTAAKVMEAGVQQALDALRSEARAMWPETRVLKLTPIRPGAVEDKRLHVSATVTPEGGYGEPERVMLQIEGPARGGSGGGAVVFPAADGRALAKALRGMLDDLADLDWLDD